jgi:hypothetical protein
MFHFQAAVDNWEEALHRLPNGALIKAVDQGSMLRTAKLINPHLTTMLRHFGGPQNIHDGRGVEAYKQLAREFFATFIDGTFREKYAQYTDLIQEWNEYLASSHSGAELQDRLDWAEAVAWVWANEYRTQSDYAHIRLALVNAPVGNNIDRKFAEIALRYDCVLSYHAYDKWLGLNNRDPLSWQYHCGRWAVMESGWGGLKPDWLFGEAGPYNSVVDGWRSEIVLAGNAAAYVESMRTWIGEIKATPAYQEGRVQGFALFTTGRTSGVWHMYYTEQPEMNMMADMVAQEWKPVSSPPPPPPPDPDPEPDPDECRGLPRTQYHRVYNVIPPSVAEETAVDIFRQNWRQSRQSAGGSYDDAGLGDLDNRTAVLWNIPASAHQEYRDWYATNYPGVEVVFRTVPVAEGDYQIEDVSHLLTPLNERHKRTIEQIDAIAVHHFASNATIEDVNAVHNERFGRGIAYGYVVDPILQKIFQCYPLTNLGTHAHKNNTRSVGVAVRGNYTTDPPSQWAQGALRWLIQEHLPPRLPNLKQRLGHRHLVATACPGNTCCPVGWLEDVTGVKPTDGAAGVVTTSTANVRSGPSTSHAIITQKHAGNIVDLNARNNTNDWLRVTLGSGHGWMHSSLLATNILTGFLPVVGSS